MTWQSFRSGPDYYVDRAGRGPFADAYRLVEAQDVAGLTALLDERPSLVAEVGTNGNDLLALASSTCDERLVAADAPTDVSVRGDGGTPLAVALFWGNVEVATVLAAHGVSSRNLRTAAGLDDVVALESLWGTPSARDLPSRS